ncbi:MAG: DUF2232 domain-containing protein [Gemmatimonadetes bacterium]|nr:DUF2232 domain-containing protein [Gemmatimonadota bacterium]
MVDLAAPQSEGRRPALGTAFALAAFLSVAPPLLLLTPLSLLLLFSRPRTGREWFWIVASAAGVVRFSSADGNLVAAFGAFAGAGFLAATHLLRNQSAVIRGLVAIVVAAALVGAWTWQGPIDFGEVDRQLEASLRETLPATLRYAPAAQITAAVAAIPLFVHLVPGLVALQALVGLGLAWRWYHRVAEAPLGPPAAPLAAFRFPDPLVWGAILSLALSLVPLGPVWSRVVHNALVVWGGLYAVRGLAVIAAATQTWSLPAKILLGGLSFLALPVATGSIVTLGLADVWVDFRRRAASQSEGRNSDGSHSS